MTASEEEAVRDVAAEPEQPPLVDPLGVEGDARTGPLPKDAGEAGDGEPPGAQQLSQDVSGPDAGVLVGAADRDS